MSGQINFIDGITKAGALRRMMRQKTGCLRGRRVYTLARRWWHASSVVERCRYCEVDVVLCNPPAKRQRRDLFS